MFGLLNSNLSSDITAVDNAKTNISDGKLKLVHLIDTVGNINIDTFNSSYGFIMRLPASSNGIDGTRLMNADNTPAAGLLIGYNNTTQTWKFGIQLFFTHDSIGTDKKHIWFRILSGNTWGTWTHID